MSNVLHLTIRGRIPSKKNNRRNFGRTSLPSQRYVDWHEQAGLQLINYKNLKLSKVEIQFEFFMPDNRETDLDNKVTSVLDVLVDLQVILKDSWQNVPKFSVESRGIEKKNPRVELWIRSPILS